MIIEMLATMIRNRKKMELELELELELEAKAKEARKAKSGDQHNNNSGIKKTISSSDNNIHKELDKQVNSLPNLDTGKCYYCDTPFNNDIRDNNTHYWNSIKDKGNVRICQDCMNTYLSISQFPRMSDNDRI